MLSKEWNHLWFAYTWITPQLENARLPRHDCSNGGITTMVITCGWALRVGRLIIVGLWDLAGIYRVFTMGYGRQKLQMAINMFFHGMLATREGDNSDGKFAAVRSEEMLRHVVYISATIETVGRAYPTGADHTCQPSSEFKRSFASMYSYNAIYPKSTRTAPCEK
ncbi:hypothetical protein BDW72DRAFT_100161 [Aspergillus terricola var. indicus]